MAVETPDLIWDLLEELRLCVCEALDTTECLCPCLQCVQVGKVAWDQCCEGMLYVTADRLFVFNVFPNVEGSAIVCDAPLAVDITVGILRCAPTINANGDFPTCQELTEAARITYTDAYVSLRALICCLAAKKRYQQFVIRNTNFVGPQGGCQGVEIKLTVELVDPPV